jgi:hypothetical protein
MKPSAVLTTPCGDVVTGAPLGVIHGVGAPAVTVGSSAWDENRHAGGEHHL